MAAVLEFSTVVCSPIGRRGRRRPRAGTLGFALLALVALANVSSAMPTGCAPTPLVAGDLGELRPLVAEAAARHPVVGASGEAYVDWLMAMLAVEAGPPPQGEPPAFAVLVYPTWQSVKALGACIGVDTSVGVAQIRPQTATQIMDGEVENGGRRIAHGVRPRFLVWGSGARGVDTARLARPEVSIEYLAANLAVGAAVAEAFGKVATPEDLARWHNTGLGSWNAGEADAGRWAKGSRYIERVRRVFEVR
jgi:hypothetical protein